MWDAGTAISGEGTISPAGPLVRVVLDAIPAYYSHTSGTTPRYRYLGTLGWTLAGARANGVSVQWGAQLFRTDLPDTDGLYYVLEPNVTGTLYRGHDVTDIAIACRLTNSAAQSIPNNTLTAVTFDTELQDPFGMHSTTSNTSRVTVPTPGWYAITGRVQWNVGAAGERSLQIKKNGATVEASVDTDPSNFAATWLSEEINHHMWLDANDYIELIAFQNSGAAINSQVSANATPALVVVKVA